MYFHGDYCKKLFLPRRAQRTRRKFKDVLKMLNFRADYLETKIHGFDLSWRPSRALRCNELFAVESFIVQPKKQQSSVEHW